MKRAVSLLVIIMSLSIGVILTSFASSKDSKTNKETKSNTITPSPSIIQPTKSSPTESPSPYTTIVENYNCTIIEFEVFTKINEARLSAGLHTLEWSDELYRAAKIRSSELVTKQSHTRPDGSSCFTVSNELTRENIAYGYPTSDAVYEAWMNSSGHKENILANDIKTCSIALHIDESTNYTYFWTNALGR